MPNFVNKKPAVCHIQPYCIAFLFSTGQLKLIGESDLLSEIYLTITDFSLDMFHFNDSEDNLLTMHWCRFTDTTHLIVRKHVLLPVIEFKEHSIA